MSSLKFGTSGLRGLVSELLGEPASAYTRAFAGMLRQDGFEGEVLIGRDLRASSPAIALLCAAAVSESGLVAVDCGAVPTPALALEAIRRGVAAIMVTGSHIPEDRNGLKFYRPTGEIDKDDEARIMALHARPHAGPDGARSAGAPSPGGLRSFALVDPYVARYVDFFGHDALKGLRVAVYQHSSVARDLICTALSAVGAEPVPLGRAATFIPVDTEALRPEDVRLAREWATQRRFDAIVSTDGDADRPLIGDEQGAFLRGDLVGVLTARALGADAVATPVTSNSAIERTGLFASVERTRVGSPYVIAGMAEAQRAGARIVVGFEANGGVLLGSDVERNGRRLAALPTRDALLPILCVLSLAAESRRPLSGVAAEMGFNVALSDRLTDTSQESTAALLALLDAEDPAFRNQAFAAHGGVRACDRRDGLRLTLGDGGVIHFRASGNAPELRVYVEAVLESDAKALLDEGLALARLLASTPHGAEESRFRNGTVG